MTSSKLLHLFMRKKVLPIFIFLILTGWLPAKEPIAPYFGNWTGYAHSRSGSYKINAYMWKVEKIIKGSYTARKKSGSRRTHSGTFFLKRKGNRRYTAKVRDMKFPVTLEFGVRVKKDGSLYITSPVADGTALMKEKGRKKIFFRLEGMLINIFGNLNKMKKNKARKKKTQKKKKPAPIIFQLLRKESTLNDGI